jgi:hypothetical protein
MKHVNLGYFRAAAMPERALAVAHRARALASLSQPDPFTMRDAASPVRQIGMNVIRSIRCGRFQLWIPRVTYRADRLPPFRRPTLHLQGTKLDSLSIRRIVQMPGADPKSFDGAALVGRRFALRYQQV